jgi:hypothetical protein
LGRINYAFEKEITQLLGEVVGIDNAAERNSRKTDLLDAA